MENPTGMKRGHEALQKRRKSDPFAGGGSEPMALARHLPVRRQTVSRWAEDFKAGQGGAQVTGSYGTLLRKDPTAASWRRSARIQ